MTTERRTRRGERRLRTEARPAHGSTGPPAAGTISARRRLPAARALTGGFAVTAAAVLVFVAYLDARPSPGRPEVVAAGPLAAGSQLSSGDLRVVDVRLPPATATSAFASVGQALGRTLAVGLEPGELVTPAELTPSAATPNLRPVPVSVAGTDLVDLRDGARVDVLLTVGSAPRTSTTMVVRGAVVLSTAQPAGTLGSAGGTEVVTIGVGSLAEVQAVVSAEHAGTVDVVVGEVSDGSGLGPAP